MTLTRLETHIRIHSQRIQKRGTERAQGSVKKDQTVRQNFLLWLFLGFTKAMLTQGRSSMGGFHRISTIWEENLNCWVESQAGTQQCSHRLLPLSSHHLELENNYNLIFWGLEFIIEMVPASVYLRIYENFGNISNVIKIKLSKKTITIIKQETIGIKCLSYKCNLFVNFICIS